MKQLTIISGKGGTGKTTLTAAFSSLADGPVISDCDCDASDLQLILNPEIIEEDEYIGSATAEKKDGCTMCGKCREVCRFGAIDENFEIKENKCEGCGTCAFVCPEDAIEMIDKKTGEIYESNTRFGPMVHAELEIGEEASGKMVTQVRNRAQRIADDDDLIIVDGSPGIGCPVIASIKGVDYVLVVAEPTVSGIHDLKRVLEVTEHFGIKSSVCINKADINHDKVKEIREVCKEKDIPVLGELPYDNAATKAMIEEETVIEHSNSQLAQEIENLWRKIKDKLSE